MLDKQPATRARRVPWSSDLTIVAAAVVCPLVMWLTAVPLGGVELEVDMGGETQQVGALAVGLTAGLSALAAVVVLRLLERRTARATRIWTIAALVVFALSLLGPLAAATPSATGTLIAMHAIVAVVVIVAARRSRRSFDPSARD